MPPPSSEVQARLAEFQARLDESTRELARDPRFKGFSPVQLQALTEFVVGNIMYVASHEIGHAVVAEMDLPVLGREEDAADDFAILTGLQIVANDFSLQVLEQATQGWFLVARRDKKQGDDPDPDGEHSPNEQRGYHIVCRMFGSDPVKFKDLADRTQLAEERRKTCAANYAYALRSWDRLLGSFRRTDDQPKTPVEVSYQPAEGKLEPVARAFRALRFLETFAEFTAERYLWPAPLQMEMRTCGEVRARWIASERKMSICYEQAYEFAELYREHGPHRQPAQALSLARAAITFARRA